MGIFSVDGHVISVGISVGVGALLTWWAWRRYTQQDTPTVWEEVGEVSELVIYPMKSGRGVKVIEAEATRYGLAIDLLEDRSFLAVTKKGRFITGSQAPKLTTVVMSLEGSRVTLQKQGAGKLQFDLKLVTKAGKVIDSDVFGDEVKGFDCGDEVAAWLSKAVYGHREQQQQQEGEERKEEEEGEKDEKEVRLLYNGDLTRSRKAKEPVYYSFPQYSSHDRVIYANTCAYMITTEASLADLNTRLPRPVTLDWFRSNIAVKGVRQPYDEDDWAFVRIGEVVLRRLKPCDRCSFIYINPETGEKCPDKEPLTTLKRYRRMEGPEKLQRTWAYKPVFGVHLGVDRCGRLRVGDKVEVARASSNPRWQY